MTPNCTHRLLVVITNPQSSITVGRLVILNGLRLCAGLFLKVLAIVSCHHKASIPFLTFSNSWMVCGSAQDHFRKSRKPSYTNVFHDRNGIVRLSPSPRPLLDASYSVAACSLSVKSLLRCVGFGGSSGLVPLSRLLTRELSLEVCCLMLAALLGLWLVMCGTRHKDRPNKGDISRSGGSI